MAAEAQHRASQYDDDPKVRKLPKEEREMRMQQVKSELKGIDIEGPLEPSFTLIHKFHDMVESGELRHLPCAELGTREAEVRGQKTEEALRTDSNGQIRLVKKGG